MGTHPFGVQTLTGAIVTRKFVWSVRMHLMEQNQSQTKIIPTSIDTWMRFCGAAQFRKWMLRK